MTITPRMLRRAVATAILVGGLLFTINSGDAVASQGLTAALATKLAVTMLIPFIVSISSSAMTMRELGEPTGEPEAPDDALARRLPADPSKRPPSRPFEKE